MSSAINYVKNTVSKVVKAVVSVAKTVATAVSNAFNEIGNDMMVGLNGYASSKNKYIRNAANAVNNAADKYGGNWGTALYAGLAFSATVIGTAVTVGQALTFAGGLLAGGSQAGAATVQVGAQAGRGSYSVYMSRSGDYVGRTKNIIARSSYWASKGRQIEEIPGLKNLTYQQARGAEQALIEYFGGPKGPQLVNKINGISKNSAFYNQIMGESRALIRSLGYY